MNGGSKEEGGNKDGAKDLNGMHKANKEGQREMEHNHHTHLITKNPDNMSFRSNNIQREMVQ